MINFLQFDSSLVHNLEQTFLTAAVIDSKNNSCNPTIITCDPALFTFCQTDLNGCLFKG